MKIVYFGTPHFAEHVLRFLLEQGVAVSAVVSQPDKPKGRSLQLVPTPVKEAAIEFNLPIHQPEKASDPDFAALLKKYNADLFVVVAYGQILKQEVLDIPKKGCINLHASLLPKWRGAAPIQRCIIHGDPETGVSIMHMVKKMDAGAVIEQARVPIGAETTFGQLEEQLCRRGSELLLKVIGRLETERLLGEEQDESEVTYAPKIELEDCCIDWKRPACELHNLIRGVNPLPMAWCQVLVKGEKKRLKVHSAEVIEKSGAPGDVLELDKRGMIVACGEGALLLKEVQLEGKKAMEMAELMRGVRHMEFTP